jgi:restriction system protein
LGKIEILDALFEVYDRLPEAFRAELPLRRTWMLVPEDEEGRDAFFSMRP